MSQSDTDRAHTGLPWRAEGPDMFGDFNILHPADSLAVAAVVSNMRPGAEVQGNADLIIRAVNSHDDLVAALRLSYRTLAFAFNRIHTLPRTSDTELAEAIEKVRADIEKTLAKVQS